MARIVVARTVVARIMVTRIAVRSVTLSESPGLDPVLGSHISDPFGAPYLDQNPQFGL
jgi:hypothetical protein